MSINVRSEKKNKCVALVSNTGEVRSQADKEESLADYIAFLGKNSKIPWNFWTESGGQMPKIRGLTSFPITKTGMKINQMMENILSALNVNLMDTL